MTKPIYIIMGNDYPTKYAFDSKEEAEKRVKVLEVEDKKRRKQFACMQIFYRIYDCELVSLAEEVEVTSVDSCWA
jgi:hypothetical protein